MRLTPSLILFVGVLGMAPFFTAAQDKPANNMQVLREKIAADKKLLVAINMDLTEAEAKAFWPVYEAYQKDLHGINQRLGTLIGRYADDDRAGTLTDDKAKKLTEEFLSVQEADAKLMKSYAPRLGKALSPKKVARYLQIENKIRAVIKHELADQIPLVQ